MVKGKYIGYAFGKTAVSARKNIKTPDSYYRKYTVTGVKLSDKKYYRGLNRYKLYGHERKRR